MSENENKIEEEKEIKIEEENNQTQYKIEYLGKVDTNEKNIKTHKVIILGLSGVGKTTICFQIVSNKFKQTSPTISLDLAHYQVKVNDKIIQIQLWDTCGNDEFAMRTPNLFNNTFLAILVYAINDRQSFEDICNWRNIVKEKCPGCILYLIGNKNDLENERKVEILEGEKMMNNYDFKYFIETSAKTGLNIKKQIDGKNISLEKEDLKDGNNDFKRKKKKNCC